MRSAAPPSSRGTIAAQRLPVQAGVGLRPLHHDFVQRERPDTAWFEVHPENFMDGGVMADDLDVIGDHYPLSFHSVGMSLGSAHGVDRRHLKRLSKLIRRHEPLMVSDHLSWSATPAAHLPDLLPLPYTEEALNVVARNVSTAQAELKRQILLENPSTYLQFAAPQMEESRFLAELVRRTGCGVLLDVNNIYVSASNAGVDARTALRSFLENLPPQSIQEIHLAGHTTIHRDGRPDLRVDDHGSEVSADVWELYDLALEDLGPIPTLIEWDTDIPTFAKLSAQAALAQHQLDRYQEARRVRAG